VSPRVWIEATLRTREASAPARRFSHFENTAALANIALPERSIPYRPIGDIEKLQRQRIRSLIHHAYETISFYSGVMRERGLRPDDIETADHLSALPLIDGNDLAQDPMRFVSTPCWRTGREVFKTSDHASLLIRPARGERDRVVIARLIGERWAGVIAREFLTNERRLTLTRVFGVQTEGHRRLLMRADFSSRTQRVIGHERSGLPRKPIHYHHLPPAVSFSVAAAPIDPCVVRIVDNQGHAVFPGTPGNIVISSLDNRSEIVSLADGRELSSLTIEGPFSKELRRTIQAQIEQRAPGCLHWRIVPFSDVHRNALRDAFVVRGQQIPGTGTTLTVNFVEEIAQTQAREFLRSVVSLRESADGSLVSGS
jgi:hypothetical protein